MSETGIIIALAAVGFVANGVSEYFCMRREQRYCKEEKEKRIKTTPPD